MGEACGDSKQCWVVEKGNEASEIKSPQGRKIDCWNVLYSESISGKGRDGLGPRDSISGDSKSLGLFLTHSPPKVTLIFWWRWWVYTCGSLYGDGTQCSQSPNIYACVVSSCNGPSSVCVTRRIWQKWWYVTSEIRL